MCGFEVEREEARGCTCEERVFAGDSKIDNAKATNSLKEGGTYKFLGVLLENVKQ